MGWVGLYLSSLLAPLGSVSHSCPLWFLLFPAHSQSLSSASQEVAGPCSRGLRAQGSWGEASSKKGVFSMPLDWLPTELLVSAAGPLCGSWVLLAVAGEWQAQGGVPSWGSACERGVLR